MRTLLLALALLAACPRPARPPAADEGWAQVDQHRTTESGLQIADLYVGDGAEAVVGRSVEVHYTGWLRATGARFDSSRDRGVPLELLLGEGRVIRGWEEGLLGMRQGGKRQLVIPPELGYGDRDLGVIPPGSTLVFDVELVSVH
jgi:FKBP-type peptidyl-prolyl cis-trans isomerase